MFQGTQYAQIQLQITKKDSPLSLGPSGLKSKKECVHCLLKSLLFIVMLSLIYLNSRPYIENIIIFCSEHWDWGTSIMAGYSHLEPYYGIHTAVLFTKIVAPSQKHRNVVLIRFTKNVPNPESFHVFSWCHGRNGVKLIYLRKESPRRCFALSLNWQNCLSFSHVILLGID